MSNSEDSFFEDGNCFQCAKTTRVFCLPCKIRVCGKCFVCVRRNKSEDYRKFLALQEPKKPPTPQTLFRDEFKKKHSYKYSNLKELTKAATTEWNSFDEGKRQEYHKRRKHEMAKFDTELSNYQSVCEEYKIRPFQCPFCPNEHSGKQYWFKSLRNSKRSPKRGNSKAQYQLDGLTCPKLLSESVNLHEESDTNMSEQTNMSTTDSQDTEMGDTDQKKMLKGHFDAIIRGTPVPASLATLKEDPVKSEFESQRENETTPEKKPHIIPATPNKFQWENSITESGTERKRKYDDVFEFLNKGTAATVKDSRVIPTDTGCSVSKKLFTYQVPESMKKNVMETDFPIGVDDIDRSFDEVNDIGDTFINEELEGPDEIIDAHYVSDDEEGNVEEKDIESNTVSDVNELVKNCSNGTSMVVELCDSSLLDSDETRTQKSLCDRSLQSQDEIDEDPEYLMDLNEDLLRRPATEPRISNQEWVRSNFGYEGRRQHNSYGTKVMGLGQSAKQQGSRDPNTSSGNEATYRGLLSDVLSPMLSSLDRSKGESTSRKGTMRGVKRDVHELSSQYREIDLAWKPRVPSHAKSVGMSRQNKNKEQAFVQKPDSLLSRSIVGSNNKRHGVHQESEYDDVATQMNIVEFAIRQESRNELDREEGEFLRFCDSGSASKGGLSSKEDFFKSALFAELNTQEDELPNLPNYRTLDEVLHGRTKDDDRKMKRNRLKRKSTVSPSKKDPSMPHKIKTNENTEELDKDESLILPENDNEPQPSSENQVKDEPDVNDIKEGKGENARQVKEKSPPKTDSQALIIKEPIRKEVANKWSVLQSIPSFENDGLNKSKDAQGGNKEASTQCDEQVTHEEDPDKKEEQMATDADIDNDELLDLISDVIDDCDRSQKKGRKKIRPKEENKTNNAPVKVNKIQSEVDTTEVQVKEQDESNLAEQEEKNMLLQAECKPQDEVNAETDAEPSNENSVKETLIKLKENSSARNIVVLEKENDGPTFSLNNTKLDKVKATLKRSKLKSPRGVKKKKRKTKNLKGVSSNILDNLANQKDEDIRNITPIGQLIKAAANEHKRSAAELNSSDSIHSESSNDELNFQASGQATTTADNGEKSVRPLRKRKTIVKNLAKVMASEDSSSPQEEESTKSPLQHKRAPVLEQLQTKQICMSPRLVLYRVKLKSVPHTTEEKQDQDDAERSRSKLAVKSVDTQCTTASDELGETTASHGESDKQDESTEKRSLILPHTPRKQKSAQLDVSSDATMTTTSSGTTIPTVDGTQDGRLSLRKRKRTVATVVITDSTTTTSGETTSLEQSVDYTGAESSVHLTTADTSKDSVVPRKRKSSYSDTDEYLPGNISESEKSDDTAATEEVYAEFMTTTDAQAEVISVVDVNSSVDFIVETSSDTSSAADKNAVLVADDPNDPDFIFETCDDTEPQETSYDTENQSRDLSTSLDFTETHEHAKGQKKTAPQNKDKDTNGIVELFDDSKESIDNVKDSKEKPELWNRVRTRSPRLRLNPNVASVETVKSQKRVNSVKDMKQWFKCSAGLLKWDSETTKTTSKHEQSKVTIENESETTTDTSKTSTDTENTEEKEAVAKQAQVTTDDTGNEMKELPNLGNDDEPSKAKYGSSTTDEEETTKGVKQQVRPGGSKVSLTSQTRQQVGRGNSRKVVSHTFPTVEPATALPSKWDFLYQLSSEDAAENEAVLEEETVSKASGKITVNTNAGKDETMGDPIVNPDVSADLTTQNTNQAISPDLATNTTENADKAVNPDVNENLTDEHFNQTEEVTEVPNDGDRSKVSEELDITADSGHETSREEPQTNVSSKDEDDDDELIVLKEEPVDVLSNMYTCREHGLAYKVYCEQEGCDMMLCSECFVRDHFGHSIVTLEKRYEVVAEQVAEPLQQLVELRQHLAKQHQNVTMKRDQVETVLNTYTDQLQKRTKQLQKIYNPHFLKKHIKSVTDFYGPRLRRRLNALDKDLEEMESIKTEMRKIENCLKALTSEQKDKKTIMALRNYNSVLKSVDDLKTKVRQFKCDDEPAEEIWFKYGLGQVLRGTFEGACDGTLDLVFRYLFPVFEASELNGFRSEMSSVDAGYVFNPVLEVLGKVKSLCADKNNNCRSSSSSSNRRHTESEVNKEAANHNNVPTNGEGSSDQGNTGSQEGTSQQILNAGNGSNEEDSSVPILE